MKNKKWLWRLLAAAIVVGLVWFYWPRSLLDITGLRNQEAIKIWVSWSSGMDDYGTRVTEDPAEMVAYLSALDKVRFQEELHFGGIIRLEGDRMDHVAIYVAEGGYVHFEYSSGDGTMSYSGPGFSKVFHISGDPGQLKPLFDLVDTWPTSEK
ncbi:MAG: hypothetical protein HFF04_03535 [Oscillospiraceae bacterium]|nr:hypothetical protein [Oscillospiraceae bacterium]